VRDSNTTGQFQPDAASLKGQRFGRWLVLKCGTTKGKQVYWLCRCDCGTEKEVAANNLPNGASQSCGCLARERTSARFKTHGLRGTYEYTLYNSAKTRAKKEGVKFSLRPEDIVIPEFCPVFGVPLAKGEGKVTSNSPSIDRIDSSLGYTLNNIWIISFRANVLKNASTPVELRKIADAVEVKTSAAFHWALGVTQVGGCDFSFVPALTLA
jgi:hypothetical protein